MNEESTTPETTETAAPAETAENGGAPQESQEAAAETQESAGVSGEV